MNKSLIGGVFILLICFSLAIVLNNDPELSSALIADEKQVASEDIFVGSGQQEARSIVRSRGTSSVLEGRPEDAGSALFSEPLNQQARVVDRDKSSGETDGDQSEQLNQEVAEALPGKEIEFSLEIAESSFYDFKGRASSTIGDIDFDSQLLPSNEVRLMLQLTKSAPENVTLNAYFDLANYVMKLDGGNAVLNKEHKELLRVSSAQLTDALVKQYAGYELPEHGFMLIQMLSYWSKSPEGYAHEPHVSVSR